MNTKKIWIISFILGLTVAGFAYLTLFTKENVSSASEGQVNQVSEDKKDNKSEKQVTDKDKKIVRDFKNPLDEISKGKRAISLKVNLEEGVSGYITQNSLVDVITYETTKDAAGKESNSAVLILEKMKVLSSGKSTDNKEEAQHYETVTFEVTPEEGVMLSLAAKAKGGFYLMLRNPEDTGSSKAGLKQTSNVIKEEGTNSK
ncbi:Flp pilus assembly protein CpaB [Bacillus sp. ISL-75]|uniref:Flp pilus assembly protein CpaB n=1 Tax=Bacillus sp. ISL-75 TaxID=2819137 RepID=UPI001BE7DA7F|nr:Flp pilus assembly protein CpaB [Bacillus sp. ISL-75]MBT2727431.1 Flp pilus assembly protein CpaB [Bacillus sp. ISL-75]